MGRWSFAVYLVHILVLRALEQTLISHAHLPAHQGAALAASLLARSPG